MSNAPIPIEDGTEPEWLAEHRNSRPYWLTHGPVLTRDNRSGDPLLADVAFNNHERNDGTHVSPYDDGEVFVGLDKLEVRLIQGIDEEQLKRTLSRTLRATTGISPLERTDLEEDAHEMFRGGLQSALESQVIVFEVIGASRALTHQLVRSRKAAFHQQSQRATWYGDRPNARWPESVAANPEVQAAWREAQMRAWEAYMIACDNGVSYQDARYILPEGTTNYITCEYSIREFINVFAYRGCSMFLWEMVGCMREMRRVLLAAHPMLEPYVKISCERGTDCDQCKGSGWLWPDGIAADLAEVRVVQATEGERPDLRRCDRCSGIGSNRKCTFQGWESVEGQCDFPWARQSNRTFLPAPRYRIETKKEA